MCVNKEQDICETTYILLLGGSSGLNAALYMCVQAFKKMRDLANQQEEGDLLAQVEVRHHTNTSIGPVWPPCYHGTLSQRK